MKNFIFSRANRQFTVVKNQQGVTLLEVLISLALGIFFLGIAVNYLIVGQQSNQVQDSSSRAQENARFASNILRDSIRLAGYTSSPAGNPSYFFAGDCEESNPCTIDDLSDNRGDRVAMTMIADDLVNEDCLGVDVDANDIFANVFWVDDIDNDGVRSLYCRGWNVTDGDWNDNAGPQPLVEGIEQMQVQYGITDIVNDNLLDGLNSPVSRYVSAAGLENVSTDLGQNAGNFIRSVRIALLVDSGLQTDGSDVAGAAALQDDARAYALLDGDNVEIDDDRIRRVFTATVELNNSFQ